MDVAREVALLGLNLYWRRLTTDLTEDDEDAIIAAYRHWMEVIKGEMEKSENPKRTVADAELDSYDKWLGAMQEKMRLYHRLDGPDDWKLKRDQLKQVTLDQGGRLVAVEVCGCHLDPSAYEERRAEYGRLISPAKRKRANFRENPHKDAATMIRAKLERLFKVEVPPLD